MNLPASNPFHFIIDRLTNQVRGVSTLQATGRVIEVIGTLVRAHVPDVRVGELCLLYDADGRLLSEAEVVGFARGAAILTLYGDLLGLSDQTTVVATGKLQGINVGDHLLGRVINGLGHPLDESDHGPLIGETSVPIHSDPPSPLTRRVIDSPLPTGIRALDALLTCCEGQRLGIFAAAGVGKSTLLSSLVRGAEADVTVVALIGERGREVREFIEFNLDAQARAKTVLVVATSDCSPMERARAAYVATAIAEYFRDQGLRVLLLMDSVTRFARALREIGLASGEPPTRRGFPPSVFATLPQLMERSGMGSKGSITAFYTVLVEGDDMTEPVADETRSILDGHIILSRDLASANHYPAIDVLASASRTMNQIVAPEHQRAAAHVRSLMAAYQEVELLLRVGEYKEGQDPITDEAVKKIAAIRAFLCQPSTTVIPWQEALQALDALCSDARTPDA